MGILVVGNEKNFTALRDRLFTDRVPAAAVLRRANAALAAANPHADLGALVPGTVLTIPDVPELPDRGALSLDSSVHDGLTSLARELTSSLVAMRDEADGLIKEARVEHKQTIAAFDDDLVRRAADGDQELHAAIEAARSAIEQEEAGARDRLERLAQAADEWSKEIDELLTLAGPG
jgi:vacuolar-type H+-ATPase subunit H